MALAIVGMIAASGLSGARAADPLARADDPIKAGRTIVVRDCKACHAVAGNDLSPFKGAPAFRTLGQRYAVAGLAEALAEGISVGHPAMPQFVYPSDEVAAIIAYLTSIQVKPSEEKPK